MLHPAIPRHHLSPILTDRAKGMRQGEAQAKLWYFLRKRRLNGFRFRQQTKVGPILADFYCHQAKLVVQLDCEGESRMTEAGLQVIRLDSKEVHDHLTDLLAKILQLCCDRVGKPT